MDNATGSTPSSLELLIKTHENTHQYRFSESIGASASSGLCASNFLRIAFAHYLDGKRNAALLKVLTTRESFMDMSDIAQYYQKTNHLKVTELVGAPSYHIVGTSFTQPSKAGLPYFTWVLDVREFQPLSNLKCAEETLNHITQRLDEITSPIAGAIITGQPEILSVLKLPHQVMGKVFIVYDSHRHEGLYPDGAGMAIFFRREAAVAFLTERFMSMNSHGIDASFVVPRRRAQTVVVEPDRPLKDKLLLEASMRLLHLELDMSELEAKFAPPVPPKDFPPTHLQYPSPQPNGTTAIATAREGRRDVQTDMPASNGERTAHKADKVRTESAHQIDQATLTAAAPPPVAKNRSVCAVLRRALRRLCAPFCRQSRVEKARAPQSGAGSTLTEK